MKKEVFVELDGYVDVEVDLYAFDDDELLYEAKRRGFNTITDTSNKGVGTDPIVHVQCENAIYEDWIAGEVRRIIIYNGPILAFEKLSQL